MFVSITAELISEVSGVSPKDFPRIQALDLHLRDDGDSGSDASQQRPSNLPKIRKIDKLNLVPNLRQLNLSYNTISRIEGLEQLKNLVELNLAENTIKKIENLELLRHLERLNLSGNEIERIPSTISQLVSLTHLRMTRNKLSVLEDVQHLTSLERLTNLRLDDNPLTKTENYDLFTIFHVPSLMFLDGLEISDRRRDQARIAFAADHAQRLRHRLVSEQHRLVRLRQEIEEDVGTGQDIPQHVLESKALALKLEEAHAVEQTIALLQQKLQTFTATSSRSVSLPYFSSPESVDADPDHYSRLRSITNTPARERGRESLAERQIIDLNGRVEKLANKVLTAEKEKQELRVQLTEQQNSLNAAQELQRELRDVERDLEQALQAAQASNEECIFLREELRQVALKLTERETQMLAQSKQNADLQEELRTVRQENLEYQNTVRELKESSIYAHKGVSAVDDFRAQEARMRSMNQRLDQDDLERQGERLQREVDDCRMQATSLNDALLRSRENYDAVKQQLASLEKILEEKDSALLVRERDNRTLEKMTESLRVEKRSLEREKQALQAKVESLENDFRSMLKAQRSTPQKSKKLVVFPLSPSSKGMSTTLSERRLHYLEVDSTDSEERDASPVRRATSRSPVVFSGTQLDKSAAEVVAHILLEELQCDPHIVSGSSAAKEACIRAGLRLVHTSSAMQLQGSEEKEKELRVELTPFHALGNRDFLSRLVAEAHAGLAALEDAAQIKEEISRLEKLHRDFENKINTTTRSLVEKEKAVETLEKHADEARRQAQATLEDLEVLHKKLQATRDEVVKADAEQTLARRELDIARHNLKECLTLSDVENKNLSQLRERAAQQKQELRNLESLLSQTREQQTKEEHKLRSIKQTITEEIRLMQLDINKLQQEFRSKQLYIEDFEKQRKLQDEESEIRKRELDAYLSVKAREVEDEVRRLNSARNDLRITKLETDTALSRKKQVEYELAQIQEKLHIETARCSAEDREASKRLEQAEKKTTDMERSIKTLRDKHMLLESERQLLQQAVDDLKRTHHDLEKTSDKKRKTADDEYAQLQQQIQIATRNYRQLIAQIENKQHEHDATLSELRAVERKNEEAKRVSRELQSKHDNFKDEVHHMSLKREKLQKEVAQLRKMEEEQRQQIFLLRASSEHESKLSEEIRRKTSLLQNEELSLHESEQKMKSSLLTLKKQIEDHAARLDSVSAAADRERRQIQELSTKRSVLEKEVFQLEERAKISREMKQEESARQQGFDLQMVQSMEEMNRIAKQVLQYEQKIDVLQRHEDELKMREQSIQSQISKLQLEHDGLKNLLSSEKTSYLKLREECTQISLLISDQQEELTKLNERVQNRRQEVDENKLQMQHLENLKKQVEQEVQRYQQHNQIEMKRLENIENACSQLEKQLKVLRSELVATEDTYEKTRSLSLEESRKVEEQRKTWRSTMDELERLENSIQDAQHQLEIRKHRAIDEIGKLDQAKRSAQSQMFLLSETQKRLASGSKTSVVSAPTFPETSFPPRRKNHFVPPAYVALERPMSCVIPAAPVIHHPASGHAGSASDDESMSSNSTSFQLSSLQRAVDNLRAQSNSALSMARIPV